MTSSAPSQPAADDAPPERPWHALPADQALAAFGATPAGLDSAEAAGRLARHGPNRLPVAPARSAWLRFVSQFHSSLIYLMLAGAALAALLGHAVDAVVIAVVVVVNAIVGFIQEGRAQQAMEAIRDLIAPHVHALRDGQRVQLDAADLVPGDIVLLEAGDRVPADLRLLRARGLLIDEAILTGESVSAAKQEAPVAADAPLGDRSGMAFSGTLVAAGGGLGVVVATGRDTQIGHISRLLGQVEALTTPLLRSIDAFGRRFTLVVLAGAAVLFAFAVGVQSYDWLDALMAVVSLAVAVVPEGLPAVITITLAIGVQRMARRQAIVRRLPAVETLGSTSIICSDKTGTLTRNEMTARRLVTAGETLEASGAGYAPEGRLHPLGDAQALLQPPDDTRWLVHCGVLCNDAQLASRPLPSGGPPHWFVNGDPMEGALLALAHKAGIDPARVRQAMPRLDEIPFDAQYAWMATLNALPAGPASGGDSSSAIFVKGAPEKIMAMCRTQQRDGRTEPLDAAYWQRQIAAIAEHGERVLGFACKQVGPGGGLDFGAMREGFTLLGVIGFIDPPRPEAIAAVRDCRSAGIAVKMITGDHAATAAAIARQLRLADDPQVLTGQQLDAVADADLPELARRTTVFARTTPEHKLRIVRALQAEGAVVAMTGDGVNDAPSLKQADVGVAMGHKGTEAAKEAAEMVLVDDNFASIVAAVQEGRTVRDNLTKVIAWTLPTNGGEILTVIIAILLGWTLPMSAAQILWINLVTTVTLGLVLAFEPAEPGTMERPPRQAREPLLSRQIVWRVGLVSVLFVFGAYAAYAWGLAQDGGSLETARTLVVNAIVAMEVAYLFSVRYLHGSSATARGTRGTPAVLLAIGAVLAAQAFFTYAPVMHAWFQTRALSVADGVVVLLIGAALFGVLELEKAMARRLAGGRRLAPSAENHPSI